jgi:hypothetical protein
LSLDGSVQGRGTFSTEFTVKNKNVLRLTVPAHAGKRLVHCRAKKVLLQLRRCVDIDRSRNMATVELVIESAIYNLI